MSADELVDVVNADDVVVGRATRRVVREQNLRHRSVYILLFGTNGDLLIHRRTDSKDVYPGHWDVAFGGVLAVGEEYDDGARRELEEECGVNGIPLQRLFRFDYDDGRNQVSGMVYRAMSDGPFQLQATEVVSTEWVRPDAVPDLSQSRQFCPDGLLVLQRYLTTEVR